MKKVSDKWNEFKKWLVFNKKYLYVLLWIIILQIPVILFLFKDNIITYNNNRIEQNKLVELKNDFKKQITGSWYTFVEILESDKWEKVAFDLIKEDKCEDLIKNIISKNTEDNYWWYKDFKCEIKWGSFISYEWKIIYNIIKEESRQIKAIDKNELKSKDIDDIFKELNDSIEIVKVLKQEEKNINLITEYKTTNWIIKPLSKNYKFKKDLWNGFIILVKNNNDWIYTIVDSTKWNNWIKEVLYKINENVELDKIQLYNSWSITEITLLEKDSTFAKKIIFDKEKLSKKTENLWQVFCESNWKCRDELKDVLSSIKVEKNYFGWTIIGNIVKWKIKKIIITPEKNSECELDLEPYELTKFDSESWEFKYNFALKWKNICPNSWSKNYIDLIWYDDKKYRITSSIKWPFYDESYRDLKFVKEKEFEFNARKSKDYKLDDLIKWWDETQDTFDMVIYKWYYKIWNIVKYKYILHSKDEFRWSSKYLFLDKKITKFEDFYEYICSWKWEKENYIDKWFWICQKIMKIENYWTRSKYYDLYNYLLTEKLSTWNDLLWITFNYLVDMDYEKYNSSYKKTELLWYKILYVKDWNYFVKWKYDLMIPVTVTIKWKYDLKLYNKSDKKENELYLKSSWNYIVKIKDNKNLEKIGKENNVDIYQDKNSGCIFLPFKDYKEFWLPYDFYSENLKINFWDWKDYWDYTFRFAWQASEIYQWVDTWKSQWQIKWWLQDSWLNKCAHTVSEEDLNPKERLVEFWDYVWFPIYKFKDDNDPYLKRRFREQYGVKRWEETGERYEQYVKSLPVVYWHDPFGRWLRVIKMVYMPQAEKMKPVIYLYPEVTTSINVKVKPNWWFKLTIPEYPMDKWWDVVSSPESEIIFEWEVYPYLFWEWKAIWYEMWKAGFVIENNKTEIERFLIEKLTKLWLNEKEIWDFNEYWIEKLSLVKNKYIFVTFASKQQQDWDSPLKITPRPDSIIRVFMDYRWNDILEEVEELEIITPVRKWFSVVEWGWAKRW